MSDYRIGVITMMVSKSGLIPLSDLITIICSLSKNIFLVTGDEGYSFFQKDRRLKTYNVSHNTGTFVITRILNYLVFQLKMSLLIVKTRKQIDIFIFFMGGDILLVPIITAHLLRKKVFILLAGDPIQLHISRKDPLILGLKTLRFFSSEFADKIIVYADRIISDYSLERWKGKIVIARQHLMDFDSFKIKKEYLVRECIIGYVGRFSEEKGILHFLHAVPEIVIIKPKVKFLFIGVGALQDTIEQYILNNNLSDRIILTGWVSHDVLADYLNTMKLLVIPSDTEGLPNVMVEAMACGTPVLATSVGIIPTFIKDGETGFILENNTPHCIASTIINLLDDEKTATVIGNAYQLIQNEFQFEKRVEEFKIILDDAA
jgi:glycosyltransferase involved in cell wall biosynthesis